MIHGCGIGEAKPVDWSAPLVMLDGGGCPKPDPALESEFRRKTRAPKDDIVLPDGSPGVGIGAAKGKLDEFRVSEDRKNRAGMRAVNELKRCAAGGAPTS